MEIQPPPPPQIAGKYILTEELGKGSFGVVFRGYNKFTRTPVAVKLETTPCGILTHETKILKYLADAGAGSQTPQVLWFGQFIQCPCLIMPYYPAAVHEIRTTIGPDHMKQVVSVLEAVHNAGIIHRDIKPRNFALDGSGRIILLDFGLASVYVDDAGRPKERGSQEGGPTTLTGNALYASPFVLAGEEPTRRDDLISAGYMALLPRGWNGEKTAEELEPFLTPATRAYLGTAMALEWNARPNYAALAGAFLGEDN